MATITQRKRKDGSISYTAQIRVYRDGTTVYNETKTFDKRRDAQNWSADREAELRQPGMLVRLQFRGVSIARVLEWYRDDFDGKSKFGRSKLSTINMMINSHRLADLDAIELTAQQLIEYARARRTEDGASHGTVNTDFVWLSMAWRDVRIARNIPLQQSVVDDAKHACRRAGLIAKSDERNRRPDIFELEKLFGHYEGGNGGGIPMTDIILFAVFSARRQDEICRICWVDLDEERARVLVRDMKHPRKKVDTWVHLPRRAMEVVLRQPRVDERIFPYNSKSVSSSFTRRTRLLGIKDLRFHDLRHEGASHLFELGHDIPRVASVTGHRSWQGLQRYTHLHDLGTVDKYDSWVGRFIDVSAPEAVAPPEDG